jgi:peroxiredoxin
MADNFLDIVTTGNQFNDAAWRPCMRPPESILNISSQLSHSLCRRCLLSGVKLAVLCLYQKQRFLEAVGMILHERFNALSERRRGVEMLDEEDDETESIQS